MTSFRVYMVEVETVFDNATAELIGLVEELSTANNIKRVIFDVKLLKSLSQPNKLAF